MTLLPALPSSWLLFCQTETKRTKERYRRVWKKNRRLIYLSARPTSSIHCGTPSFPLLPRSPFTVRFASLWRSILPSHPTSQRELAWCFSSLGTLILPKSFGDSMGSSAARFRSLHLISFKLNQMRGLYWSLWFSHLNGDDVNSNICSFYSEIKLKHQSIFSQVSPMRASVLPRLNTFEAAT